MAVAEVSWSCSQLPMPVDPGCCFLPMGGPPLQLCSDSALRCRPARCCSVTRSAWC